MRWSRSRALALGGLAAGLAGLLVAVVTAFGGQATSGVAGAEATRVQALPQVVHVDGVRMVVTRRPNGSACFSAPSVHSCAARLGDDELLYATGRSGNRQLFAGLAGRNVRAAIAKLTRKGTVWVPLTDGAFYAELPAGHRLRAVVKVLAGGRRQLFRLS